MSATQPDVRPALAAAKRRHDTQSLSLRGAAILRDPFANRDDAFTHEERAALDLTGLLMDRVRTLPEQVELALQQIRAESSPLARYLCLSDLESRNQVLYYRLLVDHVEELMPIAYTPTVGLACERWSASMRRPRGLWITPRHRGHIRSLLEKLGGEIRLVVLTDGERILGLGDLGAGGMGIPVGKLALYCAAAGFHPREVLPITLDVGTDRRELLEDPDYAGVREKRLRGPDYDALVEELVTALFQVHPQVLLQFEDFKKENALNLLARYRERVLSFNDDIEGTAAVALAGVMAAARKTGTPMRDQRVLILGAGAAGTGIARLLRTELMAEGLAGEDLFRAIAVLDSKGLLVEGRHFDEAYKNALAWPRALVEKIGLDPAGDLGLLSVVRQLSPTALVGTSGQPGVFDRQVVQAMAERVSMPAIFPLSNPNSSAEVEPRYVVEWTEGRAVVATGSPFPPVDHDGKTHRVAQGNNVWIFPGVALGAIASESKRITDELFVTAAHALADEVEAHDLDEGALYPRLRRLREVSVKVALAVAKSAVHQGIAPRRSEEELSARIDALVWEPAYPRLVLGS